MDKYPGDINSILFSTNPIDDTKIPVNIVQNPQLVYTKTITDEPCILKTRHASMFFKPYIDNNARDDLGVSDKLNKKYANESIALKLKMCIYGSVGYPGTCIFRI